MFFVIADGNDDGIFELEVNENNSAIISVAQRLDREYEPEHLLTIKCFRPYERNVKSQEKRYDPSVSFFLLSTRISVVCTLGIEKPFSCPFLSSFARKKCFSNFFMRLQGF